MAGIYVHVPFCSRKCYYCDFYTTLNTKLIDDFVRALLLEIKLRRPYLILNEQYEDIVNTIYLGGGTPSLLPIDSVNKILRTLEENYFISQTSEITFETNPDDADIEYFKSLRATGVNRLSIGIQSFSDEMLKLMNRRHNSNQAKKCIQLARDAGFENISIDLIYGLPEMVLKDWEETLQKAYTFKSEHISAYHLTYEEGTVFHNWLEKGKLKEIDDEESWLQFKLLHDSAIGQGYEHYEISNLSYPSFHSRHNSSYWNKEKYLGLGPSAHSYNGDSRQWNVANIKKYIDGLFVSNLDFEIEFLTRTNKFNEYILTGLRTNKGIDINEAGKLIENEHVQKILAKCKELEAANLCIVQNNKIQLTPRGWFVSDNIATNLMIV